MDKKAKVVYLDPDQKADLEILARVQNISSSEVIRLAVKEYLAQYTDQIEQARPFLKA